MILFLIAAGLTVILGVLRVVNFAHGSLYMVGAFLTYSLSQALAPKTSSFWIALSLVPLVTAAVSLAIERGLLRFVYGREHLMQLLLTYALVLIFTDGVTVLWGRGFRSVAPPPGWTGAVELWGVSVPRYHLLVLAVGPAVAALLWVFLARTRLGRICRATAFDREMVDALGLNSSRVFAGVFALGGYLAGLAGVLVAPTTNIVQGMDAFMIVQAFLVVILGGLGNVWGSLACAMIFGVGEALGVLLLPRFSLVFPFVLSAAILAWRPSGLLKSAW